jgi:hypothetical protein
MASTYYHSLAVGVVDLERMRLAAEDQTNILCDAVGKAFFRPGTEHFAETKDGAKAKLIEFDAGGQAVYGLELTPGFLRVWDDDALVTRPAVTTTITNGDFNSGTGWTLGTTAGTTVQVTGGALKLQAQARGGVRAYAKQAVNPGGNAGLEHGLRITVFRGPVQFRVGSSDGGQEYIKETTLRTGYHSLAFIPSGVFYVEFSSTRQHAVYVNDINVEAAGAMSLPTIWDVDELELLRTDQSLDVMFIACEGRKQQRVESRGDNSWSVSVPRLAIGRGEAETHRARGDRAVAVRHPLFLGRPCRHAGSHLSRRAAGEHCIGQRRQLYAHDHGDGHQ